MPSYEPCVQYYQQAKEYIPANVIVTHLLWKKPSIFCLDLMHIPQEEIFILYYKAG